jgi:hypothetical protein
MIALEFLAIITALLMEAITLQTGSIKTLTDWLMKDKTRSHLFLAFLLWTGSLLYMAFGIAWCFSTSLVIQASGLVLISLSAVSAFGFRVVGKDKPLWFTQLDSTISMACVVMVAIARIKGF